VGTCAPRFPAIPSLKKKKQTNNLHAHTHSGETAGFAGLLGRRQKRFRRGGTSHHHRVVRVGGLYISDTYASAEEHREKFQRVRERGKHKGERAYQGVGTQDKGITASE
jgi:hypothetical protein